MNYLKNCVFVNETDFNTNIRTPIARPSKGTLAIVVTPTAGSVTYTILDTVSLLGAINLAARVPITPKKKIKVDGVQKRKKTESKKNFKGTVTGHYMHFIHNTMIEIDKFSAVKRFYI
jgi:hypothetical protein